LPDFQAFTPKNLPVFEVPPQIRRREIDLPGRQNPQPSQQKKKNANFYVKISPQSDTKILHFYF
jgi:hypothetical protein